MRAGIHAIVLCSMYFLILSLVAILVGVIVFAVCVFCTLGVCTLMNVFLIIAVWISSVLVRCGLSFTLGGFTVFGSIVSAGALVALSTVTLSSAGLVFVGMGVMSGSLFKNASSFLSALICSDPFWLFLPFNACVRSLRALVIASACVRVGCMMYFVLNNTVSDTLLLLVCLR